MRTQKTRWVTVARPSATPLYSELLSLFDVMMTPEWRLVLTTANIAADTQVEDSHILLQSGDKAVENIEKVDDDVDWINIATIRMRIMACRIH